MRKFVLTAIAVFVIFSPQCQRTTAQDKQKSTLEQDRQKLEGRWRTNDWGKEGAKGWQCLVAIGVKGSDHPRLSLTINFKRGSNPTPRPVLPMQVQLKEKGDKRWFDIDPETAKLVGLPSEIIFHLDDDSLSLKLADGEFKGEYKLKRVKEAAPNR